MSGLIAELQELVCLYWGKRLNQTNKKIKYYFFAYFASYIEAKTKNKDNAYFASYDRR